jgi:DNA-binding response OmpR family regulator
MRILIADDDANLRQGLAALATTDGFEPVTCGSGEDALKILCGEAAPPIGVLDWMMAGLTGPEVCSLVRKSELSLQPYLIVLTVKTDIRDIMAALDAGANDHMRKPFSMLELRARVRVGKRVVELQTALRERIIAAETALAQVEKLRGLLPVCANCRKVRDDKDYWQSLEAYLAEHVNTKQADWMCAECAAQLRTGPA